MFKEKNMSVKFSSLEVPRTSHANPNTAALEAGHRQLYERTLKLDWSSLFQNLVDVLQ
jgi:hypothetical protein